MMTSYIQIDNIFKKARDNLGTFVNKVIIAKHYIKNKILKTAKMTALIHETLIHKNCKKILKRWI